MAIQKWEFTKTEIEGLLEITPFNVVLDRGAVRGNRLRAQDFVCRRCSAEHRRAGDRRLSPRR